MRANKNMEALLYGICVEEAEPVKDYPIWRKQDESGRTYWGTTHFWGLDKHGIPANQDLSELEWDGNEVYLKVETKNELPNILTKTVGIIKAWRMNLERDYPDVPFYIIASYDNGDFQECDDGEEPTCSVTLRFWSHRTENSVVNLENFDEWEQPALLEKCGF